MKRLDAGEAARVPPDPFVELLADLLVLKFLKARAVATPTAKSPSGVDRGRDAEDRA